MFLFVASGMDASHHYEWSGRKNKQTNKKIIFPDWQQPGLHFIPLSIR